MRLRKQSIQNLIQAINLPEHLQRYIEIKRSGGNAVAKCAFHQDSSPSMYVYAEHYHCFACKAHGSILDYEMHRTGHSFREVVESLAEQYNIPLEYETSGSAQQNALQNERFEKIQRDLEKTYAFFKTNCAQRTTGLNNKEQAALRILTQPMLQHLDVLYTGNSEEYRQHFSLCNLEQFVSFNYANCLAFPLYKENGKISGFYLSRNLAEVTDIENISLSSFCEFLNIGYRIVTPFPKRTLQCLNWQQIRAQVVKQKQVYIVTEFIDFSKLYCLENAGVVLILENQLSLAMIKEFSAKVSQVVMVLLNVIKNKAFLWNTFKESINISNLNFEVLKIMCTEEALSSQEFDKFKQNTKKLWEEIIDNFIQQIPGTNKLAEFNKKILPIFYKITEQSRRELLLEEIAKTYFSSSKVIFTQSRSRQFLSDKQQQPLRVVEQQPSVKDSQFKPTEIPKQNDPTPDLTLNNEHYKEYLEKTIQFYHRILFSQFPFALEARAYLEKRGFTKEHLQKWRIGLCPNSHELARKLENKQVPLEPLSALGLLKKSKQGNGYYDFFHDRIIIPIYSHNGEPVGLSGRIFSENHSQKQAYFPKYINSPESKIFAKAQILFNFYAAMQAIVSYGYVIVVEGYMDCISLVNAGVTNTVAVMGTSLTHYHLETLSKVTKRIVLCFDSDTAGKNAAKRSFTNVFHCKEAELECLVLPEGKDPDEFIKKFGVKEFLDLISQTVPLLTQVSEWLFIEANRDSETFLRLLKQQILPAILQHPEPQVQNESLHFLCDRYFNNLYPEDLRREMQNIAGMQPKTYFKKELENQSTPLTTIEWPALTVTEVKLILSLVHAKFSELPERLCNVALAQGSEIEANERICALAISNQMSKMSFSVYLEFLSAMVENQHISLLDLSNSNEIPFSEQAKLVIAYVNSDVHVLYQYKMEELLKESLPARVSMVSFKNIWDLKNSGFLRFQLRNIRLSAQRGVIAAFIAEALLQLELEYIDNALKAFSSFHFDNEIDEQFHYLITERTRRKREFGSFSTFSLQ